MSALGRSNVLVMVSDEMEACVISCLVSGIGGHATMARTREEVEQCVSESHWALIVTDAASLHSEGTDSLPFRPIVDFDGSILAIGGSVAVWDKVRALEAGADAYIARPYEPAELVACTRAALRRVRCRSEYAGGDRIQVAAVALDVHSLSVTLPNDRHVRLSPSEMQVLRSLMLRSPAAIDRHELAEDLFGADVAPDAAGMVGVYINRLRRKIEPDVERPRHIVTVRGTGYRFDGEDGGVPLTVTM